MMRTISLFGAALLLAGPSWSCGADRDAPGTTFEDSAGVALAIAREPLWGPGEDWRIGPEPVVEIGVVEGPGELMFSDVVGAVRLSDGRIVVADRGSADLRFYDARGRFLLRAGREGAGPGEFRNLGFVGRLRGDTLVTWDSGLRRLQLFGPTGEHIRSFRLESRRDAVAPDMMIGVVDERRLLMEFSDFSDIPDGIVRWPHEMLALVDVATGSIDSLATLAGPEAEVRNRGGGGYTHGRVLFAKGNEYAAGAGRVVVISTEALAVRILGLDGTTRRILRRPVEPRPVTDADVREQAASVVALVYPDGAAAGSSDAARLRTMWEEGPRAPTVPLLRSVHLDAEGNVWVEPYFHIGATPEPFQVFASDGTWLGTVVFPPGHVRGTHPRLAPSFEVGADYILGVWQDDLDVQYVRLYGLDKDS